MITAEMNMGWQATVERVGKDGAIIAGILLVWVAFRASASA
ncbi:hypothetical protein [Haladaptatus caseinilyticus]|nr:hypothetical protein [Haladaptatus caseinilyticus]